MDNKTKTLCVAIAILLAYSGYLRYRLVNAEGKAEAIDDTNSSDSKKISDEIDFIPNSPIGTYLTEGSGVKVTNYMTVNKIYLRDDGKVEFNDKVNGTWKSEGTKGHYKIDMKDHNIMTVRVDGKGLYVTSFGRLWEPKELAEKEFIRFKKVE